MFTAETVTVTMAGPKLFGNKVFTAGTDEFKKLKRLKRG